MIDVDGRVLVESQIRELHRLSRYFWEKYDSATDRSNHYLTALSYAQTAESAYISLLKLLDGEERKDIK